ncbi:cell wall elongation regulator TseB-like domain-containing protein [Evansella halocellulosilytica]|uniref:cell wall elongation regulator TseB-like domain-containing protein n=1 Tax=Evansella halocellulosilytica TaxID=2011013 RepID=UPI000BB67FC7|nr:DUF5590 domain-containing protein [Evansella halocellulosilytica]
MKAWVISIASIIFIGLIAFFLIMYTVTGNPLNERQEMAIEYALNETELVDVTNVDYYHGNRSYQVVHGINESDEEIIVWVEEIEESDEEERDRRTFVRNKDEGMSVDQVRQLAYDRLDISSLQNIRLGVIGSTPVYEIVYTDDADRHSFYYVTFDEGSYIRHYQFRQS